MAQHDDFRREMRPEDKLAIERLLDQQELADDPAAQAMRELRRSCGRWLMLRRLRRGLSLEDVARRVGADAQQLRLLELGLADQPLLADEVWRRLSLVLEGDQRDFERVAAVLELTLGRGELPDLAWAEALEADLGAVEQTPASTDLQLLQEADRLVQEVSRGKLPRHNVVLVLQVLRQAFDRPLELADIKLQIEKIAQVSLNLADLPDLLERLRDDQLVKRIEGDPPTYRITPRGSAAVVAALNGSVAKRDLQTVLGGSLPPLQGAT